MLLFRSRVRHWGGRSVETAGAVGNFEKITHFLQLRALSCRPHRELAVAS